MVIKYGLKIAFFHCISDHACGCPVFRSGDFVFHDTVAVILWLQCAKQDLSKTKLIEYFILIINI